MNCKISKRVTDCLTVVFYIHHTLSGANDSKTINNQSDPAVTQSTDVRQSAGSFHPRSTSESRDLMSEINDYIESINENFAAYSRESIGTPNRSLAMPGETPKSALKITNKSFTEDSIVPSNEQAETLFGNKTVNDADFNDPSMTEKSLKDIGFSYNHNKYLSRSRNFVNHRKEMTHVSPMCVQLADRGNTADNSVSGGIRPWQGDRLSSTTVTHSPMSSPYNSDSSLEKENLGKKTPRSKAVSRTRHTFLHSPTTSDSADNLSTVDTDSHVLHHASPVSVRYSNSSCVPVKNATEKNMYVNSGDEVTFV